MGETYDGLEKRAKRIAGPEEVEGKPVSVQILQNSFFTLAARVIQAFTSFFVVIAVARYLSIGDYGRYAYIMALVTSSMAIAYFGIQFVLIRDVARNRERAAEIVGAALKLRSILVVCGASVAVTALLLKGFGPREMAGGIIAIVSEALMAYSMLSRSVFQAFERMIYEPLITMVYGLVQLAAVGAVVIAGLGLVWIFAALALSNLAQFLLASRIMTKNFVRPSLKVPSPVFWGFFRDAAVIGLGVFFYQNLFRIHVLMLEWVKDIEQVPFFQVPHSLIVQFTLVPMSVVAAVYPVCSKLIHEDIHAAERLMEKVLRAILFFAAFVSFNVCVFSQEILVLAFGAKFAPSGAALAVLAWAFIPLTLDMLFNAALVIMNQQRYSLYYASGTCVFAAVASFLLVPSMGYMGSAWVALAAYMLVTMFSYYFARKVGVKLRFGRAAPMTVLAVAVAVTAAFWLKPVSLILAAATGSILYFGILFLGGCVTLQEIEAFKTAVRGGRRGEIVKR